MNKLHQTSLKKNPFTTYRDPETGQWRVVFADPPATGRDRSKATTSPAVDEHKTEANKINRALAF